MGLFLAATPLGCCACWAENERDHPASAAFLSSRVLLCRYDNQQLSHVSMLCSLQAGGSSYRPGSSLGAGATKLAGGGKEGQLRKTAAVGAG